MYNSAPIIRKNNRQQTITLSTSEAELDSFSSCVRSVLHTMKILERMGSPLDEVKMFEDNRSTIAICTNMSPGNSRTKLVDLKIKWFLEDLVGLGLEFGVKVGNMARDNGLCVCVVKPHGVSDKPRVATLQFKDHLQKGDIE
jgi:hypothetical protein